MSKKIILAVVGFIVLGMVTFASAGRANALTAEEYAAIDAQIDRSRQVAQIGKLIPISTMKDESKENIVEFTVFMADELEKTNNLLRQVVDELRVKEEAGK